MARRKCTPFGTFGTTFPRWEACHWILSRLSAPCESSSFATPEGELLAMLCLEMLMRTKAEWRANLPLRGRCRRQKGCISTRRRRGCTVFAAKGSAAAERRQHTHRPKGDTTTLSYEVAVKLKNLKNPRLRRSRPPSPLNLLNPLNPLNPGRRRRPIIYASQCNPGYPGGGFSYNLPPPAGRRR